MLTDKRKAQIVRLVREQIAGAVEHDLKHGETVMKEVYEEMLDDEEQSECYREMRAVIGWLRGKKARR